VINALDPYVFSQFALMVNENESGKVWDEESNKKTISKFESLISEIEQAIVDTETTNITQ